MCNLQSQLKFSCHTQTFATATNLVLFFCRADKDDNKGIRFAKQDNYYPCDVYVVKFATSNANIEQKNLLHNQTL